MKFSESWLREFCNPPLTTQALVDKLTMAGLEVESVEPVAADFSKVVVGEVLKVEPHPDADKLLLCQVTDGGDRRFQVVCGADNVREGMKAPFALIGARLPDAAPDDDNPHDKKDDKKRVIKVRKAKLRGQTSEGMLCSERELGISDNHDGLMVLPDDAPLGKDLMALLALDDRVIDLDLTPNRGDCLSLLGLGRETALMTGTEAKPLTVPPVPASIDDTLAVELAAGQACPTFVGRVVRGIDQGAQSPLWMKERLRRSGIRSIDPVVDVTNYVMLELGQPLHAYDCNRLAAPIVVRQSRKGEKLRLLDGSDIELKADTLLITDQSGPIGMAGIMGGQTTAVTADTVDIYLESAFFSPLAIAGRARTYGMATDASHRFERGVDWQGQVRAIERATGLLLDIAGGKAGPVVNTAEEADLPKVSKIVLRALRVSLLLGVEIADSEIEDMLARLGFDAQRIEEKDVEGGGVKRQACWEVQAPSHRFDITIEADLIEEISRVYGYNNLPIKTPDASLAMAPQPEDQLSLNCIKDHLAARGYLEAITYSFVDDDLQAQLNPNARQIPLENPLSSDMSVMRTTLWVGLLKSLAYNLNRHQSRVRLFETGLTFRRLSGKGDAGLDSLSLENLSLDKIGQVKKLAGVACGSRQVESWANDKQLLDFYDIKGDLESLFALTGDSVEYRPASHPALHPGQSAEIFRQGQSLGCLGLLDPRLQQKLEIRFPVYLFEIDTTLLLPKQLNRSRELSRYPEVRRDLALLVARAVTAAEIRACIEDAADETLTSLKLFDVYEGEGIEEGRKSLALGLTFQHSSRTLADEDVTKATGKIVSSLEKKLGAQLRG